MSALYGASARTGCAGPLMCSVPKSKIHNGYEQITMKVTSAAAKPVTACRARVITSRHRKQTRRNNAAAPDQQLARQHLRRDEQLGGGEQTEQHSPPDRVMALGHEYLVEHEHEQWRYRNENQEEVSPTLPVHVRREPVEQPADIRSRLPCGPPQKDEICSRGRACESENHQNIERGDRPPQKRDGGEHNRGEQHRRIRHEIDAVRIVDPIGDQRIVTVDQRVRSEPDEPGFLSEIGTRLQFVGGPVHPREQIGDERER